jgi:hypothetical protein
MARTKGARGVTAEQKAEIVRLARTGMIYPLIASTLGMKRSTVAKVAMSALGYRAPKKGRRPLSGGSDVCI